MPVSAAHQMDVYQENEELKEELSKLAAKVAKLLLNILCLNIIVSKVLISITLLLPQVEFYKIVGMVSTNHHIKKQKSTHFSISHSPKPVNYLPNVIRIFTQHFYLHFIRRHQKTVSIFLCFFLSIE